MNDDLTDPEYVEKTVALIVSESLEVAVLYLQILAFIIKVEENWDLGNPFSSSSGS